MCNGKCFERYHNLKIFRKFWCWSHSLLGLLLLCVHRRVCIFCTREQETIWASETLLPLSTLDIIHH
jgi:hypothetical protein